jgi:hypothetical protein
MGQARRVESKTSNEHFAGFPGRGFAQSKKCFVIRAAMGYERLHETGLLEKGIAALESP